MHAWSDCVAISTHTTNCPGACLFVIAYLAMLDTECRIVQSTGAVLDMEATHLDVGFVDETSLAIEAISAHFKG